MSDIQDNAGNTAVSPLAGMLSDPAALSSVLSAINPKETSEGTANTPKESTDILSGLLSNPEMLAKLPAMIETVKPLLQNLSPQASEKTEKKEEESVHSKKRENDRRVALLLALKPYLSQSRCDAIDYIVKISGITEMFR